MTEKYEFQRTSPLSAIGSAKVLAETNTTRLLLRNMVVENQKNPDAKIKISIVHQRKTPKGTWEDTPTKPLSSLNAGEQIKLNLDSATTLELFHQLENLYAIAIDGKIGNRKTSVVVAQASEAVITDANRATIIRSLLSKGYSNDVWQELIQVDPDLVTRLSYAQIHTQRKLALKEFQTNLTQQKDEGYWQGFFEKNPWIFGYGLNYKFSTTVQTQPQYGGVAVTGKGMQKGDTLQKTEAEIKFTVLVEIKKPNTQLLGNKAYRNGACELGGELTGGVSQIQANCRTWEKEGSQTEQNAETLLQKKIFTVQPKGILVIGHTNQLNQIPKRTTFELFRRNTVNPEILTFDELYERAKFIVEQTDEVPPAEDDHCPF